MDPAGGCRVPGPEGEVRITGSDGTQQLLGPGDTAHFPAGSSLVWEVPSYVKKLAIHRAAKTLPDRVLLKVSRILGGRFRAFRGGLPGPPAEVVGSHRGQ